MAWSIYLGLALSAFTSASLLPGTSEALLATLVWKGHPLVALFLVATLANTAGSVLNWWLGREVHRFAGRRWFPVSQRQLDRAQAWHGRYGRWALLLSWLPVVGDPLTVMAGVMRQPLGTFIPLVMVAKGARYGILLWATQRAVAHLL